MKITYTGRQMDVPEDLKILFEKKLPKLDKFFSDDASATVKFSRKRGKETIELTISSGGTLYRSEKESSTFQSAFDEATDAIERQIRKNKTRLEKRLREGAFSADRPEDIYAEERSYSIHKKVFKLRPMTADEAILQMNLLDHEFYVFDNAETGTVSVVYRRLDGDYGLIVQD